MAEQNQVEIVINGGHYFIGTTESPQYLHEIAREVDREMAEFTNQGGLRFADAAILCLIQYADNLKRSEKSADHLRAQIAEYLSDAAKARNDLEDTRRAADNLRRENELLRAEVDKLRHTKASTSL